VILAHNHPSGVAEPSQADELITTRIRDALSLVDIRVLDHLVVTGDAIVSFAERGSCEPPFRPLGAATARPSAGRNPGNML